MRIRQQIQRLMDEYGIDQSQLAEQADYPRSAINALLSGKKKDINVSTLEKIARALGHHVELVPDKKRGKVQ